MLRMKSCGNLGAVLGPVGLHHAGIGQSSLITKPVSCQKSLTVPQSLSGESRDDQPALVPGAFDAGVVDLRQDFALLLRQRLRRTLGAYAEKVAVPLPPPVSGTA
jgi:hypothetical protein